NASEQLHPLTDETWLQVEAAFGHTARAWQKNVLQATAPVPQARALLFAPTAARKEGLFRLAVLAWPQLLWVIVVPLKDLEPEQKEK
ncbi:hypothetical protein OC834_007190, partial [Tilletia horrida]